MNQQNQKSIPDFNELVSDFQFETRDRLRKIQELFGLPGVITCLCFSHKNDNGNGNADFYVEIFIGDASFINAFLDSEWKRQEDLYRKKGMLPDEEKPFLWASLKGSFEEVKRKTEEAILEILKI